MTVAVGFHCRDGIVLAADSELSNSTVKYPGTKAWIYKYANEKGVAPSVQIGIVGSGDAYYLQYAAERINNVLEDFVKVGKPIQMGDVNALIQGVVNDIHHNHLYPYSQQPYERPSIELLIGIWLGSHRIRLARTHLTAITKVWHHEAVGAGSDLANFVIKRFYGGRVSIAQGVFVASEALKHAKDFVPGCGGQSNVIAMYQAGIVGFVAPETISAHETYLKMFDEAVAPVFFSGTNAAVNDHKFAERVDQLAARLKSMRSVEDIQGHAEQVTKDASRPPMPTDSGQAVQEAKPTQKPPRRGRKVQPASQA